MPCALFSLCLAFTTFPPSRLPGGVAAAAHASPAPRPGRGPPRPLRRARGAAAVGAGLGLSAKASGRDSGAMEHACESPPPRGAAEQAREGPAPCPGREPPRPPQSSRALAGTALRIRLAPQVLLCAASGWCMSRAHRRYGAGRCSGTSRGGTRPRSTPRARCREVPAPDGPSGRWHCRLSAAEVLAERTQVRDLLDFAGLFSFVGAWHHHCAMPHALGCPAEYGTPSLAGALYASTGLGQGTAHVRRANAEGSGPTRSLAPAAAPRRALSLASTPSQRLAQAPQCAGRGRLRGARRTALSGSPAPRWSCAPSTSSAQPGLRASSSVLGGLVRRRPALAPVISEQRCAVLGLGGLGLLCVAEALGMKRRQQTL